MFLANAINKEIYLLCGPEDDNDGSEHFFSESLGSLIQQMKTLSPTLDQGARVIHGILTPAEYLPSSLRGKTAFVIFEDPSDKNKSVVFESSSMDCSEIAEDITTVMDHGGQFSTVLDIDNTFIMYGYELSVCLAVDEDDIDEETIDTCKKIVNDVQRTAEVSVWNEHVKGDTEDE